MAALTCPASCVCFWDARPECRPAGYALCWRLEPSPAPPSLLDRHERIKPTWKGGGPVDYSLDLAGTPPFSRWDAAAAGSGGGGGWRGGVPLFALPKIIVPGAPAPTTVAALAAALELVHGVTAAEFDAGARAQLHEMFTWKLPPPAAAGGAPPPRAMLIFSFDATPACRSLDDCPTPGPANELLAATAAAAYAVSGGALTLHPQWEVAAALRALGTVPEAAIFPAGMCGSSGGLLPPAAIRYHPLPPVPLSCL